MITLLFWVLVLLVTLLVLVTAGAASFRAAPWLPTRRRDVDRVLRLARIEPGELVVDLGCGDGRLTIAAAERFGARSVGIELSFLPFCVSWLRARLSKARRSIRIRFADFYTVPLKEADVVVCFLTPEAMKKLKTKFVQELKPGARIISYAFSIQGWPGGEKDKPTTKDIPVHIYQQGVGNGELTHSTSVVE